MGFKAPIKHSLIALVKIQEYILDDQRLESAWDRLATMKHRITLLDGGMGQELFYRSGKAASPLFSAQTMIDDPGMVIELHKDFIKAGADLISLNSYASTPERLERDANAMLFEPLQNAAVQAALTARKETKSHVRIAGCLPPLVASYHSELVPKKNQAIKSYGRIVELQAPSVDLFIAETMSCVAEVQYVCTAVSETRKPIWISFTVKDDDGTLLRSGETLESGIEAAVSGNADGLLVNCSKPEAVGQSMPILSQAGLQYGGMANSFLSASDLKAGEKVDKLATRDDLGPTEYANHAFSWIERGATLVGGCCGVGPAHILEIHQRLNQSI